MAKHTPQRAPQRRGLATGAVGSRVNAAVARVLPFLSVASAEDRRKATSESTKMAAVLAGRQTYVRPDQAIVDKRRARNKRARRARAMHRRVARR